MSWACYKSKKSPSEIKLTYGKNLGSVDDTDEPIDVYDFYDKEDNIVCTDSTILKKRTKTPKEDRKKLIFKI